MRSVWWGGTCAVCVVRVWGGFGAFHMQLIVECALLIGSMLSDLWMSSWIRRERGLSVVHLWSA